MKKERQYYILITKPDDYKIDVKNMFSFAGFPERHENTLKKMKNGDRIVYYITGKYSFGAITEVNGKYYYDDDQVWSDWFYLYPSRIKTKPIYIINNFSNMVFIKNIWDQLEFIKNKKKWGAYFQGSLKHLNKRDYKVIEKHIRRKVK
jgi:predicted RNA-binding protein